MAETSATTSESTIDELVGQGGQLLQQDKIGEAQTCFESARQLEPENEKVLALLGLTLFRLSDFESANGIYSTLVQKHPEDASYRLNLGLVHLKLNRPLEAIQELDKSCQLDPSQIRTVSYLGLAYARNGQYEKAYEAFLRADQSALAVEMEQYLDEDQIKSIRERSKPAGSEERDAGMFEIVEESPAPEARAEAEPEPPVAAEPAPEPEPPVAAEPAPEAEPPVAAQLAPEAEPPVAAQPAPEAEPVPERTKDGGMITQAVEHVVPSAAAAVQAAPVGHSPPQPVSNLATQRLLRPSEGGESLEIGAGGVLVAQVNKRLISRTQGVMVSSGELGFEPATRRIRGEQSDEVFGTGDAKLFVVTGDGFLVASSSGEVFAAARLDGDALYLREEYVFAFDPGLRWENGRIPGSEFRVAQFRGTGCVAMRTPRELLSVKLSAESVIYVESDVLAGWIGRVVPRLVKPAAGGRASTPFVECSGEGVVLIHDMQGDS